MQDVNQTAASSSEPSGHATDRPILGALRRLSFKPAPAAAPAPAERNGHSPRGATPSMNMRTDSRLDRHSLGFMLRYLRPGDTVLDVGANTGAFAIAAARVVGAAGRVDAFEPSPTVRARLVENIAKENLKSVIVVHNLMAGTTSGLGRFVDGTGKSGRRRPPLPGELATRVIGVEAIRLEQFIGNRRVALISMDIAGGEFNALRGAESQLRNANPPALLVAVDSALTEFGITADLLADWLDERGYEITLYDVDRNMVDYPETPWRQRRIVLAMARSARNHVLKRLADHGQPDSR
jgi:FkbM family methyltransferase